MPPINSGEKAFFQESAVKIAVIPISAKSLKGAVTEEISKNTATEFLESLEKTTKDLPEKLKNDPLMYHEIAIAYTQGKISIMIQEILCRLFCDETA